MTVTTIIIAIMFGCVGFFFSFFAGRTINVALLILFAWVPLKIIEKLGMSPDWGYFFKMREILLSLWKVMAELLANMLTIAPTAGLVLFALGGLSGFIMNLHKHH